MVIVAFKPGEKEISKYEELDQYDYGQILRIQGLNLPPAVEIHFALQKTGGTSKNRIGITKDGVTDVPIPDSMLENEDETKDYDIYAFIYITDETSGQTEYRIALKVKARPKPEIPGGGDNPDIFHEAVEAVSKAMEAAAESERRAEGWAHGREDLPERLQDNAKYYSEQAREDSVKTDADRKEVKRLVESVSGIGEQVEKVEGLTKQAQTSATNAALSEQATKESENNAAQARAGAEVAEDNAELAAQKVEQDKAIVEQTKNLVKQMGQEVLDNKNLVDETAQDFDLKAQQAFADVNNAGQAQTERVQTAGDTAVESVKTEQGAATHAVQTEGTTQAEKVSAEGTRQTKQIENKGQEVLQSIPKDFPAQMATKLDKQQGVENAGKVLVVGEDGNVVPQEETTKVEVDSTLTQSGKAADAKATGDKILQFAIKNTVTGENPLIVSDSAEEKMQGLKVFGKSEQLKTNGYQLLDMNKLPVKNQDSIVIKNNKDGSITFSGNGQLSSDYITKFAIEGTEAKQLVKPGNILINSNIAGDFYVFCKLSNNSGPIKEIGNAIKSYNITQENINSDGFKIEIGIYAPNGSSSPNLTIKPMLYQDGDGTFEPYTGGKQSPSPEYPQEIVGSGDSGNITIDMNTTNLFDINAAKKYEADNAIFSLSVSGNKIKFTSKRATGVELFTDILGKKNDAMKLPPGKYTLSFKSNKPFGNINGSDTVEIYACIRSGNSISYLSTKTKNYVIFEIKEGNELGLRIDINKSGQSAEFYDIMLNRGEVALPYEPYFNQSLTLSTPNGLPGIKVDSDGNYTDASGQQWICDEIDLAREKYIQRIYITEINESIIKSARLNWEEENKISYAMNIPLRTKRNMNCLSNRFVYNKYPFYIALANNILFLEFGDKNLMPTVEKFKQFLTDNKTTAAYILETPIERDLTPEEVATYKELHTNYPTTVISNDENTGMEVSYVADTKHYIDKKFEELNQAIINTQISLL